MSDSNYSKFAASRYSSKPASLYRFVYGTEAGNVICFTDADQEIIFNGETYVPRSVACDEITSSALLDKSTFTIAVSIDNPIAELFRIYPPSVQVTLQLFQGDLNDPENQFLAVWSGRVLSCSRKASQAELTCEMVITSMRRPGLSRNWQFGCPLYLYGNECRADQSKASVTATIEAVTDTTVTLSGNWYAPWQTANFANGMLSWISDAGTESRTIQQVKGNTLTLSGDTMHLTVGATVTLALGCDHTRGDCLNLHNNILNFGGDEWIPTKNPFASVNYF